jgi:hypothetical protein
MKQWGTAIVPSYVSTVCETPAVEELEEYLLENET